MVMIILMIYMIGKNLNQQDSDCKIKEYLIFRIYQKLVKYMMFCEVEYLIS